MADQAQVAANTSDEPVETPTDSGGVFPLTDMVEQSIPVTEFQVLRPTTLRDEGSEADQVEQSVEVPVDEDEANR